MPIQEYRKYRDDKAKLEELCTRLNYREIQKENDKKKYDFLHWHKPKSQAEVVDWWLSEHNGKLISHKTLKTCIHNLNHFFKFLHQESEGEIPELKFTFPTLTHSRIKKHEWARRNKGSAAFDRRSGQYISDDDFQSIYENSPDSIKGAGLLR